ncbi:MAG: hypothetical protein P8X74_09070 [Reinekea sp.]|jgi:hypothetical protein
MSIQKTILFTTVVASAMMATAIADVGVLDKYECHNHHETNEYHCHGPADFAKLGGLIVSADVRGQIWSADSDSYMFAGFAVNSEYNYRWFAATGSFFYMPLVTGVNSESVEFDSKVVQRGWELGAKAGSGVGRKGNKYYLMAGWSNPSIKDSNNSSNDGSIGSYYAGLGYGFNTDTLVFDIAIAMRNGNVVKEYLSSKLNKYYDKVSSFDTRVSLGWRF